MRRTLLLLLAVMAAAAVAVAQPLQAQQRLSADDGLPSNTVRNIVQDDRGYLWLGTDNGLCRYDGTQVRTFRIAENGMDQYVMALSARGDSLVVSTGSGVFSFHPRRERFCRLPGVAPQRSGRGDSLRTADGRQWYGTWEQGLTVTARGGQPQCVVSPQRDGLGYHIHKLYDLDGRFILMGCDEGVVAYDRLTGQAARWPTPKFVYAIERDHEGGLWLGTFYDGVYYVGDTSQRFESVPGHVISRFCQDASGRLWIASDDAGLGCRVQGAVAAYAGQDVLGRANVHALLADGSRLWVGTYSDGVYRLDGHSLRHYTARDGLYDNSSYVIFRDGARQLWVGTMGGLCRYDAVADSFIPVRRLDALPISMAAQGRQLWIATQGGGLCRYDGRQWHQYRHGSDTTTLADDQVNSVLTARDGRLWVATQSGLCLYRPRTDDFRRVSQQWVSAVVEGTRDDELWLATSGGVVRFSPATGRSVAFTRADGLVSNQFQPSAGFRDADGYIYFGTANGYSRFLPSLIHTNKVRPRVSITGLELLNRAVPVGDDLVPEALDSGQRLELSYDQGRMFSLHYAALSYAAPSKNQYAYRLDGFDRQWNEVGSQTKATYTNLPPGQYTFRVRATNNDGLWSDGEATLTIVVSPPFWLTWWAKLCYVLMVVAALWWFMRLRLRRVESRLHREEVHRIAEIASNPTDNEFLVRMNRIIEENFANPDLNVNFLAEHMAISRSGLFAKTKAVADVTPNEMIQVVRLKRAAQMLAEGSLTVSEVCYRVGFSSPSYFSKCFTRQFGVKPTEWKEQKKPPCAVDLSPQRTQR